MTLEKIASRAGTDTVVSIHYTFDSFSNAGLTDVACPWQGYLSAIGTALRFQLPVYQQLRNQHGNSLLQEKHRSNSI